MDLSEAPATLSRRHPWETSRARFFGGVIRRAGLHRAPLRALDVGGGDGWFASRLLDGLHPDSTIVSWDSAHDEETMGRALDTSGSRLEFTAERPARAFDLLMLLDVLEHVEDDESFLRGLVADSLEPGGHLLVSVPAWQPLFGGHDVALRHHRRYQPAACRALLERCGVHLLEHGGLFHSLLAPRVAQRLAETAGLLNRPPANLGAWRGGPLLTRTLEAALSVDNLLSLTFSKGGLDLPGLSWWALCRKPS